MDYHTKYNIGDTIWAIIRNRVQQREIMAIEIQDFPPSMSDGQGGLVRAECAEAVFYRVRNEMNGPHNFSSIREEEAAATKEELIAKL